MLRLIIQTKRKYKKKRRSSSKNKEEMSGGKKDENNENISDRETEDDLQEDSNKDQDSDVSFQEEADEEIDATDKEEEWIDFIKRSTEEAEEHMKKHKIPCWIEVHKRTKWRTARRIITLPQKRWNKRVFEWQPGLDPTLRTKRSVGIPKRRWEDDLNEFTKTEEGHDKAQYELQNNNSWMNEIKDYQKWKENEEWFSKKNNCDGADLAFLTMVVYENHHGSIRYPIPDGNVDVCFSVFNEKHKMPIVLIPAYFTHFQCWLKAGAGFIARSIMLLCGLTSEISNSRETGESISMDPIINENDDEFNDRLRAEQEDVIHFNGTSGDITLYKKRTLKNMQTYTLDQILMIYKVLEISRNDETYKTLIIPSFLTGGNITTTQIFPVSDAAATCSDLPYAVTDCADTATVSTAEFLEDSGDVGVFTHLKTGMMRWQKAQSKKQKRKKNKKTRPSTLPAAAACSYSADT